jgi:hypothetical protein
VVICGGRGGGHIDALAHRSVDNIYIYEKKRLTYGTIRRKKKHTWPQTTTHHLGPLTVILPVAVWCGVGVAMVVVDTDAVT